MNKIDHMPLSEGRYLAFLIVEAARLQRTVFDRRVRKMGFTRAQWLVLRRVCDQPGVSQRDLAEVLEIERASAGRLIDKLEEFGWLERRPDDSDRRVKRLFLTDLGRKIHRDISPIAEAMVAEELSGLTGKEREALTNLLLNVKQRLQDMASEAEPMDMTELKKINNA